MNSAERLDSSATSQATRSSDHNPEDDDVLIGHSSLCNETAADNHPIDLKHDDSSQIGSFQEELSGP
ncbi:hypothetical protein D3C86_1908730 [compost metagenome]